MSTLMLERETKETVVNIDNIIVENGRPFMVVNAGTVTIKVPINNGTITDVQQSMEAFWKDLVSLPSVQQICQKHGVIIDKN